MKLFSRVLTKAKPPLAFLVSSGCAAILGGCASQIENIEPRTSISNIDPAALEEQLVSEELIVDMSIDELIEAYQQTLSDSVSAGQKRQISVRLADLKLKNSEEKLIAGEYEAAPFAESIEIYKDLIDSLKSEEPGYIELEPQERIRLNYQLSKAYSYSGNEEQSQKVMANLIDDGRPLVGSSMITESRFRLAESAFNNQQYALAETYYLDVLADETSEFQQNAHYMLGWSYFKQNRYEQSLISFIAVLDDLLLNEQSLDFIELDQLSTSEKNLVEDSLRAMSIAFSYMGGAISIADTLDISGARPYMDLLYSSLGALYKSQARYRDAADTHLAFVDAAPFSIKSPSFSELAIQTYYDGNFPSLILPAKESFIASYGPNSLFWLAHGDSELKEVEPFLHEYLQELASHYHSLAQIDSQSTPEQTEIESTDRKNHFLLAANYYEQFLTVFPKDDRAAELAFLRAEAFYEANEFRLASHAYQQVAYDMSASDYSVDAGFNQILAIDQMLESTSNSSGPINSRASSVSSSFSDIATSASQELLEEKVSSSVRFANAFSTDLRAAPVLSQAMDIQFNNQNYEQSMQIAERLMNWPNPDAYGQHAEDHAEITRHATYVNAQAKFVVGRYAEAETVYRQLLEDLKDGDLRVSEVQRQIAMSLYRQAEELLVSNKTDIAVEKMLAAANFLPDSDIAVTARFDAANTLSDIGGFNAAIVQFETFAALHPEHDLAQAIPAKLAMLYQETRQWKLAADNLLILANKEEDSVLVEAQSVYLAAELYQKAGRDNLAKTSYQRYAENYPEPRALNMEARYQLTQMVSGKQRQNLLNSLIGEAELVEPSAESLTERELYLVAWASNQQALALYQNYQAINLSLPLSKSLNQKKHALEKVLDAFNKVLAYQLAEFTTSASYRIAEVYKDLSRSMMDSERPGDLDTLALEQYEILLEEQAFPFEEKAIELHEINARRSWDGVYDHWVQQSLESLGELLPARYNKHEQLAGVSYGIH